MAVLRGMSGALSLWPHDVEDAGGDHAALGTRGLRISRAWGAVRLEAVARTQCASDTLEIDVAATRKRSHAFTIPVGQYSRQSL